jgi:hypothetical protein
MDFLHHREGGSPLTSLQCTLMHCINCKRLRESEEIKSQGKAVEVT